MSGTAVAIAIVLVVLIAIGGFILYQNMAANRAAQAETDPAALIGRGIGDLVNGIVRAAS